MEARHSEQLSPAPLVTAAHLPGEPGRSRSGGLSPLTIAGKRAPPGRPRDGAHAELVASNLPLAVSSFVGRDEEMAEVTKLVAANRLVTLTGPAGIGKTRLALEVAATLLPRYRDGAWLAELGSLTEPAAVPRAVATVLSVQEVGCRELTDSLVAHLRERRLLLLLDTCEHVVGACAELTCALLRACPGLSILATSREPMGIVGETVWRVAELRAPEPGETGPDVHAYEAVRLFVDRASTIQPRFSLSPEATPAVAEICRRLDGIPLAIELAAARVEVLSPAEIARGLDDRFAFLTGGSRSAPLRHQTLLAAVEWSYELLSEPERALFRRLSVFAGGFTVEAAEAVCGQAEVGQAFDLVVRLVVKSLAVADTSTSEARYRLLDTIRAYGRQRLAETGEAAELQARHARWCVALAEQGESELTGPGQQRWLERLGAEHDNLRSALEWALGEGQTELALRLAGALVLFWRVGGHFSEGRRWLEQAVASSVDAPPALRAKGLWGTGLLALVVDDVDAAVPVVQESVSLYRQLGDARGTARALLALAECWRGDPAALPLLEEAVALARQAGDAWCLAHALALSASEHASRDELDGARDLFEQCLAVAREGHDKQGLQAGLIGLGSVALRQGDYRAAQALLDEALGAAEELGDDCGRAATLSHLAELAIGRGDYGRARKLLDEVVVLTRELGRPASVPHPLVLLGRVAQAQGDLREARRLFEAALGASRSSGARVGPALGALAEVTVASGDGAAARVGFELARAEARASGDKAALAEALFGLASLARASGDDDRAASLHYEALGLRAEIGHGPAVAASLEAVAGLAVAAGRLEQAARLFGAAERARADQGYARPAIEAASYAADLARLRQGLPSAELEAAWAQGTQLSLEEAVDHACRGRGPRRRPDTGWDSLTRAERQVAALVAEGLSNRQIAERLFISVGTVKAHLSHVFAKLGMAGRAELRCEVWRRQGQSSPPRR